jgi:hypothetical protein
MRGCRARTKKDGNERERERELKRRLLLELNEAVANVKIIAAKLKRVMRTSAEGGSKMTKRQTAAKHTAKERANQPTKRGMSTGGATSLTPKNRKKASAAIKTIVRKPIPTKVAANTARKPGPPIDVTAIHSVSRKHDRKVTYMVSTDGLVANQIPFHFDAANRTDQCKLLRLLNGFYDSDFLCEGGANAHMRPTVAKHIEMLTESIAASGQGNAHSFPPYQAVRIGSQRATQKKHKRHPVGPVGMPPPSSQLRCTPHPLSCGTHRGHLEGFVRGRPDWHGRRAPGPEQECHPENHWHEARQQVVQVKAFGSRE